MSGLNPSTSAGGNEPIIWERMPNEPHKWFIRFERYKLLGTRRSVFAAYQQDRQLAGKPATVSGAPQSWRQAFIKYSWQERAEAWDLEEIKQAQIEWQERQQALREKEWEISQSLIDKAKQMLVFPLATTTRTQKEGENTIVTEVRPTRWNMADAAKILETASKVARLAAEMETSHSRLDLGNMTDAEIVELIKRESAPTPESSPATGAVSTSGAPSE